MCNYVACLWPPMARRFPGVAGRPTSANALCGFGDASLCVLCFLSLSPPAQTYLPLPPPCPMTLFPAYIWHKGPDSAGPTICAPGLACASTGQPPASPRIPSAPLRAKWPRACACQLEPIGRPTRFPLPHFPALLP
eukprot:EG_transcript_19049